MTPTTNVKALLDTAKFRSWLAMQPEGRIFNQGNVINCAIAEYLAYNDVDLNFVGVSKVFVNNKNAEMGYTAFYLPPTMITVSAAGKEFSAKELIELIDQQEAANAVRHETKEGPDTQSA